jgi:hypothetical protein
VGYLSAALNTAKLRGTVARGITVHSNDATRPRIHLTIRARIVGSVILLPHESITITEPPARNTRNRVLVRKEPSETGELQITDLRPSASWLRVSSERLDEPRPAGDGLPAALPGDWLIQVDLEGDVGYGRLRENLSFKTGLTRQPEVSLPVGVNIRPPLHLSVNQLQLPPPAGEEPSTATVVISVRPGLDPKTLTARAVPEALKVVLEPSGGNRFYKAHVSWDGGDITGGKIEFTVGPKQMTLPVTAAPAAPPAPAAAGR